MILHPLLAFDLRQASGEFELGALYLLQQDCGYGDDISKEGDFQQTRRAYVILSRWWFQILFIFIPNLEEKIPDLTDIFQMG